MEVLLIMLCPKIKLTSVKWRAPPRLLDALHDITILDDLQDECDTNLCYTALLHGFWGQIWAYLEGNKFHLGHKPDSAHQLCG